MFVFLLQFVRKRLWTGTEQWRHHHGNSITHWLYGCS